jgi:uncharacterized integral membrane protein (TIGR00697 family)
MEKTQYKYLIILVTLFVTTYLVTGMVQYRLVALGKSYFSFAILVYLLSYLISDMVTEVYGYRYGRHLVWCGIVAWLIAGLCITVAVHLEAPTFWSDYAKKYDFIMSPYLRYALSSVFVVLLGQFINIYMVSRFKVLMKGRLFWVRSITATLVGDGITISIAVFFIYYGKMALVNIGEIIALEIIINIIYVGVCVIPASFLVAFLKRAEGVDVYDTNIQFNPFKFGLSH